MKTIIHFNTVDIAKVRLIKGENKNEIENNSSTGASFIPDRLPLWSDGSNTSKLTQTSFKVYQMAVQSGQVFST